MQIFTVLYFKRENNIGEVSRKLTRRLIGQFPVTLGTVAFHFSELRSVTSCREQLSCWNALHVNEQSEYSTNCKCYIPSVSATLNWYFCADFLRKRRGSASPQGKMVNEQKFRHAFMFTACFILLRLGVGSGAKCGGRFYHALTLFPVTFVVNLRCDIMYYCLRMC